MYCELVRTLITYTWSFTLLVLVIVPIGILMVLPFSWSWVKATYFFILKYSGKLFLFFTFLPVKMRNLECIPKEPVIFVSNHQSALDILLLIAAVGDRPHLWLAKEELFKYPVIGRMLKHLGIPVYEKTGSRKSEKGVVEKAVEKLSQGYSIILFPEGGRFNDETIHSFFSGFAAIAKLSGAPVVPCFISGVDKALPMGTRIIRPSSLELTIGDIFIYNPHETVESFKKRVYDWYAELNWRRNFLIDHYGIRIAQSEKTYKEIEGKA